MMSVIGRTSVIGSCGSIGLDDAANRRHQLRERRRRADHQLLRRVSPEPAVVHLAVGQVDLRLAVALEPAHADVADDADDRPIVRRRS